MGWGGDGSQRETWKSAGLDPGGFETDGEESGGDVRSLAGARDELEAVYETDRVDGQCWDESLEDWW